jgi:hypothetical protein
MKNNKAIWPLGIMMTLLFFSCKKQEVKWSSDWVAPIADGKVQWSDLLDEKYLQINQEGWYDLVYDTTIDFGVDSLLTIQDTTIQMDYEVPVSVSVPPGVMLINETQNQSGLLPQDVELKALNLSSGILHYRIENHIHGPLHCLYSIQRATILGMPLEIDVDVNAGTLNSPGVVEGDLDLSHAQFDLTGVTGFLVNDLSTKMQLSVSTSATQNIAVVAGETISIEVSFIAPEVAYARGYFGQQNISLHEELSLGNDFPQGEIQLQALNWDCEIQNWMGVDVLMNWNGVEFTRNNEQPLSLTAPGIGQTLAIARAEDWQGAVNPQWLNLHWDEENSNLLDVVQYIGGTAIVDANIQLNPLGNANGSNDFVYPNRMMRIHSKLHAPLAFNAKDMTAEEWLDFSWDSNADWNGKLSFQAENAFPFDADVAVMHESELLGIIHINAGGWNETKKELIIENSISTLTINPKQWEGIKENGGLRLRWVFNTTNYPEFVRVRPEQYAALKVIGDFTLQTTIE